MVIPRLSSSPLLVAAVVVMGASRAAASSPTPAADLQPYRIKSPNGMFIFEVNPSEPNGAGPSDAILMGKMGGEIVWKRKLPYTFRQACVNDTGHIGGFGYTMGPRGGNFFGGEQGELFIRILDPKGTVIHQEITKRGNTPFYTSPPWVESLGYDDEHDRMVVLMYNGIFRSYGLRQGMLRNALPMSREDLPDRDCSLSEFRVVPRTPFLLLELVHHREKDGADIPGSVFALMDPDGELAWTFNHEWILPENWEQYSGCRVLSVDGIPPIREELDPDYDPFAVDEAPPPDPPGPRPVAGFELYLGGNEHGQRVAFQVLQSGEEESCEWKVAETGREKWSLPAENEVSAKIPRIEANKLGEFRLMTPDNNPLGDLAGVVLGPDEQIYAFELESATVHVFDREGKPLHRCRPGKDDHVENYGVCGAPFSVSDAGEVFVLLKTLIRDEQGDYQSNPKAGHALCFSPDGRRLDETLFLNRDGYGQEWFAQPGGTNIVVKSLAPDGVELVARDRSGTQLAKLVRRPDGDWLVDIEDIAFARDGSFAIRTSTWSAEDYPTAFPVPPGRRPTEAVSIFGPKGEPIRTIDFTDGASFDRISFDGSRLVAARSFYPYHPFLYLVEATGEAVGLITIEELVDAEDPSPVPFIVGNGSRILIVDLGTARVLSYAMPE